MQKTLVFAIAIVIAQIAGASSNALAQIEIPDLFNQAESGGDGGGDPEFRYSLLTNKLEVGGHAVLTIEVLLPPHRYTYSMQDKQAATKLKFDDIVGLKPTSEFTADRDPLIKTDKELGWVSEKYYDSVAWTRHYQITDPDAKLSGGVIGSFCTEENGGSCLPFDDQFFVKLELTENKLPAPPAAPKTRPYAQKIAPTMRGGKPSPVKFQLSLIHI